MLKSNRRQIAQYRNLYDRVLDVTPIGKIVFLLRDDFLTNEAAPLASPRVCEPGPGTLTIVQTDGTLAIIGERCTFTSPVTPPAGYNELGFVSQAITTTCGTAFLNKGSVTTTNRYCIPLAVKKTEAVDGTNLHIFKLRDSGFIEATTFNIGIDPIDGCNNIEQFSANTEYNLAIVCGGYNATGAPYRLGENKLNYTYGATYFIRGGIYASWTLFWRSPFGDCSAQDLFLMFSNYSYNGYVDDLRIPDRDFSNVLVPDSYIANPNVSDNFDATADMFMALDIDSLPGANQIEIRFRIQDALNYWQVTIDSAGTVDLDEVVAGVATQRGTSAALFIGGNSLLLRARDTIITIVKRGTSTAAKIRYVSANNFKTETGGLVNSLGTGGVISDLHTNALFSTVYDNEFGVIP